MKVAFCTGEIRNIEKARRSIDSCRDGRICTAVDYFQDTRDLIWASRRKAYDLVLLFADCNIRDKLQAVVRLRELNREGTVILVSRDEKDQFWYRYGTYRGTFNRRPVTLYIKDIYRLKSCRRIAHVCTKNEEIRITAKLDDEEMRLPAGNFFRVNQGEILNLQYVKEIQGNDILMDNGCVSYVSCRRRREFLEHYRRYMVANYCQVL